MRDLILCIDIGGSKLMTGLVDMDGNMLVSERSEWHKLTARSVMDTITDSAHALLRRFDGVQPAAIGITIPGLADPKRGYWVESSFSGIRDLDIAPRLQQAFGAPAYLDNDGQACALAERVFGVCRDVQDFLYMTVSNGVGGAVFMNDGIYYGAFGNAGEIGHCVVEERTGRPCKCGSSGCLEMHASGRAIPLNYFDLGGGQEGDSAAAIATLARTGNRLALSTFAMEGYYLGKAIAAACNLLNPAKVVIGGGVSLSFDLFEKSMLDTIDRYVYRNANSGLTVLPTAFGSAGGIMGAAAVAVCGKNNLHNYAGAYAG